MGQEAARQQRHILRQRQPESAQQQHAEQAGVGEMLDVG